MSERCATCKFWRNIVNLMHGAEGDCRRYPAKDTRTGAYDWCGEWRAKAQEPAKPKEREPGWYWVRIRGHFDEGWRVAEWVDAEEPTWRDATWLHSLHDHDMLEIDERRIERRA